MNWGAYLRDYRAKRRAAGVCRSCPQPRDGGVFCSTHAEAHRAEVRRYKAKRRAFKLAAQPPIIVESAAYRLASAAAKRLDVPLGIAFGLAIEQAISAEERRVVHAIQEAA